MYLIDTHTHLYDEAFDGCYQEKIDEAVRAGVRKFLFPGIDSSVREKMVKRAEESSERVIIAEGLHPTSVKGDWMKELDLLEEYLSDRKASGIGEIGLDCYWSKEFVKEQKEAFAYQMRRAAELDLPVIIHIRDAHDLLFETLDKLKNEHIDNRGIFHAFTGSIETYRRIKSYGEYRFGIGGVVTYKKAGIAETIRDIPLSDIVLETDSPWLTPVPHRGERNEPAYLIYIAAKIAELKGCDTEKVAEVTTQNAKQILNIR